MRIPLWEILARSKNGALVEEKQFDLSIFRKGQELQQKYGIKYNPEEPLDGTGELADRIFHAGVEFFLSIGTYCVNTRRVIRISEKELLAELAVCPQQVKLGQGDDRVTLLHRDVEGKQEPIVIAGIQTAPFSNEEMMFTISRGCALDRCVDGIWGGILLKIDNTYDT